MRTEPNAVTMAAMGVAGYLAELDAALVGPARVRRDLVREAGDHLEDATEAYQRAGRDAGEAEHLALRDFGTLDEIVPAFQTTLAVAAARRTAWLLLGILAIQPFLWTGDSSRRTARRRTGCSTPSWTRSSRWWEGPPSVPWSSWWQPPASATAGSAPAVGSPG